MNKGQGKCLPGPIFPSLPAGRNTCLLEKHHFYFKYTFHCIPFLKVLHFIVLQITSYYSYYFKYCMWIVRTDLLLIFLKLRQLLRSSSVNKTGHQLLKLNQ